MTKDDFFERLEVSSGRTLSSFQLGQLQIPLKINDKFLNLSLDAGFIDSMKGHVPEFLDISEVESRYSEGKIGYWLYDKPTKTWVINMRTGSHEIFAGTLYNIHSGQELWEEDAAEKYIKEHCGFFVSGVMNMYIPIKDEAYELSDEELIFNKAKGRLDWRGI